MISSERPVISDLERSGTDVALEIIAFAAFAALWIMILIYYPNLPQSIPRSFNASGQADNLKLLGAANGLEGNSTERAASRTESFSTIAPVGEYYLLKGKV
jgi:hypothetical protein